MADDTDFALALVDALSRAHNARTCARAAFDLLRARFSLVALRLELDEHPQPRVLASIARKRGGRDVAARFVYAPLVDVAGQNGTLVLGLAIDAALPPARFLSACACVVAAALRQVSALGRVAQVSRRAHARSRALDAALREHGPGAIVAGSAMMRHVFANVVPAVAQQTTSVLIQGETGTGKELVARRIHELSPRARGPFVRVNCGAIPGGLVESALFGHERGAFTGAVRRQVGLFERAQDGTLFLDEIGELPLAAQPKLLRVLEMREMERVGGDRTVPTNARVLAATHRDLQAMVRDGTFRSDLFYRLDVVSIRIPPLRERVGEIDALAAQLLDDIARRMGRAAPRLTKSVLKRLRAHPWRGNVRELQNVLERSMLFSEDGTFDLDLGTHALAGGDGGAPIATFAEASRRCIEEALAASEGHIYGDGGAARRLDLEPTTLASKMKKLGIPSVRRAQRRAQR